MPDIVLLLAGGSGSRMRGAVADKTLAPLGGTPVLMRSLLAFVEAGVADAAVIVRRDAAQGEAVAEAAAACGLGGFPLIMTDGGAERRESVMRGLLACPAGTGLVFIHDGARPLVRQETLRELAAVARRDGAAVLCHRVTDTVKRLPDDAAPGTPALLADLRRDTLRAMETPQVFRHDLILPAYRETLRRGVPITDDVAAAVACGVAVTPVENPHPNPKITTPEDLAWCEFLLGNRSVG